MDMNEQDAMKWQKANEGNINKTVINKNGQGFIVEAFHVVPCVGGYDLSISLKTKDKQEMIFVVPYNEFFVKYKYE